MPFDSLPIGRRDDFGMADIPRGHYRCILADPPWRFICRTGLSRENWHSRRDVDRHYPTMSLDDIKSLPVGDLAHPDAHLFLWVTGPCLELSFEVIRAWGFRYSSLGFNWLKLIPSLDGEKPGRPYIDEADYHTGLGLTTRHNSELCLLARRGNAKRQAKDVRELIISPVQDHSRKPQVTHQRIERYCRGPYLELFARHPHETFDCWGKDIGGFVPAERAA